MFSAIEGPLIGTPQSWIVVFDRQAAARWTSCLALGRHKHVRAFGYVPFLHVWVFFDPHMRGIEITIAADGEPANRLIGAWLTDAAAVRMPVGAAGRRRLPVLGWCVPAVKRLIGLRCGALRPDALLKSCLRNGGTLFGAQHGDGSPKVQATGT